MGVCLPARGAERAGRCLGSCVSGAGVASASGGLCVGPHGCLYAPHPIGVGGAAQRGKPYTRGPRPARAQLARFPGRFILLFYGQAWRQPL